MENWQNLSFSWAPSSEFVSSSIPSWQILTAHAQPFRGARDLAFCLKVPLDSLLIWASSEGSGETAQMRRLAWTFAARIGYKYQIRLTRSNYHQIPSLSVLYKESDLPRLVCPNTLDYCSVILKEKPLHTGLTLCYWINDGEIEHPLLPMQLCGKIYTQLLMPLDVLIWAASWQNQQNDQCA